jgi:hypothetical protein
MKKLLFSITTLLTINASAQVYHPFPTGNANWEYQYFDDFHMPTNIYNYHSFSGDTVIANLNYKQVINSQAVYEGAIREQNKRIYFIPDSTSTEYLLYDFNLTVGDKIIHPFGGALCSNDTVTITAIDSLVIAGTNYIIYYLSSSTYWIDGIGAATNLLTPCNNNCLSGDFYLHCVTSTTGLNYSPMGNSCIVSTKEQTQKNNTVTILPNPFTTNARISVGANFEQSTLSIINTLGQVVKQQQVLYSNETLTNQNLVKGLYFYQVKNNQGATANGKFIVE